jgi:hypothetical protein
MATHADVDEMFANAKRARSMANAVCSPEYKRMLAGIADDYERLAHLRLIILDTQQHLADSRRLVDGHSNWRHMWRGIGSPDWWRSR